MMMALSNTIPYVLGSLLGVMLAILFVVLLLFYKKRNESIEFKPHFEKMTRGLKKMSRSMISQKGPQNKRKSLPGGGQPTLVLPDTRFWVPEVYNSIVQPAPVLEKKTSRLQSTLDQEIYSKAFDTSYLQATDSHFETNGMKRDSLSRSPTSERKLQRVESLNRGMLNFSLRYKRDIGTLYVVVLKAEGLNIGCKSEPSNPFVYIEVTPSYKHRLESDVHQNTQNPIFNQIFAFEVSAYDVREQTIIFTVLDFNPCGYDNWEHEIVGIVLYKLESLEHDAFFAGKEFVLWNKVENKEYIQENGVLPGYDYNDTHSLTAEAVIQLGVQFLRQSGKLNVHLKKARNLPVHDRKGRVDHPYMSMALKHAGQTIKKIRVSIVKGDINPFFNKNIPFEINDHPLDQLTLTVKLRHHCELARDRTFAILKLGKEAVTPGSHWTDLVGMRDSTHETDCLERWHALMPV